MTPYNIIRMNALPVVNEDFFTIIGAEDRSWGIVEIDIVGAGTASNYTEFGLYHVATAGVTPTNAVTIVPAVNSAHPAAVMLVWRTWATQPVVGNIIKPIPCNQNAFRYYWKATKLEEVIWKKGGADATSTISLRALTVSGNASAIIKVVEI